MHTQTLRLIDWTRNQMPAIFNSPQGSSKEFAEETARKLLSKVDEKTCKKRHMRAQ